MVRVTNHSMAMAGFVLVSVILVGGSVVAASGSWEGVLAAKRVAVDNNPEYAESYIDLANAQWIMGYNVEARASLDKAAELLRGLPADDRREFAGAYYTAKAWLEYNSGQWRAALDNANEAIKFSPDRESRLVKALATAHFPSLDLRETVTYLRPGKTQGPNNRNRNLWWVGLMGLHWEGDHSREYDWGQYHLKRLPGSKWREMLCRRDVGFTNEVHRKWEEAADAYRLSAERSDVGEGGWAIHEIRLTPVQSQGDTPMEFWMNPDFGYVTGSVMSYTGYSIERILNSPTQNQRELWARGALEGASRCLALYGDEPWLLLWQAIGKQFVGAPARSALAMAEGEFAKRDKDEPLLLFAFGHADILDENFEGARPWLEKAAIELPGIPIIWAELGVARAMTGDREGARMAFDMSLSISSDWVESLHNRGVLNFQEGLLAAAHVDLARAAELAPDNQQVLTDLQRVVQAGRD